jgi:deoxycytidylate deaminase
LVAVKPDGDRSTVDRFVDLLLGDPFQTPTRDEQGMFSAWGARFRSSAGGRQVGAAIVDRYGEVIALGCNDVPKPGGGQYWPDDVPDLRDFRLGYDANDRGKHGAASSLLKALRDAGWLADDRALMDADEVANEALNGGGPLDSSEFADLIEYGRIVHAEMAALMTAARSGRSVEGSTLYTTTYPCHECARLIIAAGVKRVCFVDPYPKSRASRFYDGMWGPEGNSGAVTVVVEQFAGVSPRMFSRLFEASNRAKKVDGSYEPWVRKQLVVPEEELADSIPLHEEAAAWELKERESGPVSTVETT